MRRWFEQVESAIVPSNSICYKLRCCRRCVSLATPDVFYCHRCATFQPKLGEANRHLCQVGQLGQCLRRDTRQTTHRLVVAKDGIAEGPRTVLGFCEVMFWLLMRNTAVAPSGCGFAHSEKSEDFTTEPGSPPLFTGSVVETATHCPLLKWTVDAKLFLRMSDTLVIEINVWRRGERRADSSPSINRCDELSIGPLAVLSLHLYTCDVCYIF